MRLLNKLYILYLTVNYCNYIHIIEYKCKRIYYLYVLENYEILN